jgi:hypothetical protein
MKHRKKSAAVAALTAAAVVASSPGAWAANVDGTTENTVVASSWDPPSPDSAGITYIPGQDRLLISDSEVNEITSGPGAYQGANLFLTTREGSLEKTFTTLPWSNEPTGVAYNPSNGHVYVSDDDKKSVFVMPSLDATKASGFKTSTFGNTDPEGIAYDSKRNELLLVNGQGGARFYRLSPGPNGKFDGVSADDVATEYDLTGFGLKDPEGIAYDAVRDTVLVSDDGTATIYELAMNGSLINTIDISGVDVLNAAGVEVAPASGGSGKRNYYLVDRGLDNNSHPNENDGQVIEVSAQLAPITNRPPAANAGVDQMTDLGESVTLTGAGSDEDEGQTLTFSWAKYDGPGTVTFGSPGSASTTADFSATGRYVLRLTVRDDGGLSDFDDVIVTVYEPGETRTVSLPIVSGTDDAIEGGGSTGDFVNTHSADNEFGHTGAASPVRVVTGLRFADIPVPQGGEIVGAKVQFKVDETGTDPASYVIRGHAVDDSPTFVHGGGGDITKRLSNSTTATVAWEPPAWTTIGLAGEEQQTPELRTILQEIVDRRGWTKGNAASFIVSGATDDTGRRTAEAKDGLTPPVLLLQFKMTAAPVIPPPPGDTPPPPSGGGGGGGSTPPPSNTAPTVDAGSDATVPVTGPAALDGTVTDDGLPTGTLSVAWTKVSGLGEVAFADAKQVDTGATFSAAGSYTLRLTASDGALSTSDDVVIKVQDSGASGATEVTLDSARRAVRHSGTVRLDGTVAAAGKAASGATVEVYVSRAGGRFRLLTSATAGDDGAFSFEDRPDVNSVYVAFSDGSSSGTVRVLVRPRMRAHLRHSIVKAGTRTAIVGRISPASDGHLLRLQKRAGDRWRTVRTVSVAAGGERVRFRFVVRPRFSRAHWYRVVSPPQAGRARAVVGGRQLRLRAYEATVKRVNHGADVVVVRNTGRVPFSLEGWTLVERWSGRRVGLPEFVVRRGRVVRIHTGEGTDDGRNLHLGAGEMWAVHGVAELRDARLRLADRLRF